MSEEKKVEHMLEDGIGRVQDGADGLFGKTPEYDALTPGGRSALAEAMRDVVIDQPLFALFTASLCGFIVGILLGRKG